MFFFLAVDVMGGITFIELNKIKYKQFFLISKTNTHTNTTADQAMIDCQPIDTRRPLLAICPEIKQIEGKKAIYSP